MLHNKILLPDHWATQKLAQTIQPLLRKKDLVTLKGDLGTGKTEFARALLREFGVKGDVPSPTFTLLQTYETSNFLIFHFDLYRLKSGDELDELGWDDALNDGLTLVEWPEKAQGRLSPDMLEMTFTLDSKGVRSVDLIALGNWLDRI
jgi:tRNA threonylcarbamoyl adenosine modification protein YjeE